MKKASVHAAFYWLAAMAAYVGLLNTPSVMPLVPLAFGGLLLFYVLHLPGAFLLQQMPFMTSEVVPDPPVWKKYIAGLLMVTVNAVLVFIVSYIRNRYAPSLPAKK